MLHLSWSHFKPEFSGKPDEDAEAHLLHTKNWMNVHHFVDSVKIQRFCFTLLGEARLWFESIQADNKTGIRCITQVAVLLGYAEPQILEVFKNTLPTKLYWIIFPLKI